MEKSTPEERTSAPKMTLMTTTTTPSKPKNPPWSQEKVEISTETRLFKTLQEKTTTKTAI
jgi:hypothetical protein